MLVCAGRQTSVEYTIWSATVTHLTAPWVSWLFLRVSVSTGPLWQDAAKQFVILRVLRENVKVLHTARAPSRRFYSCVNYVLGVVTANLSTSRGLEPTQMIQTLTDYSLQITWWRLLQSSVFPTYGGYGISVKNMLKLDSIRNFVCIAWTHEFPM